MRLSFDFEYEDYDDPNWLPRLGALRETAAQVGQAALGEMGTETLLERMEAMEELMRYYTAEADYTQLEAVMRLFQRLMGESDRRGLRGTAARYFQMIFERVNALLYRASGQNRKAAQAYQTAGETAWQCADALWQDGALANRQKLYVGWACAEVLSEAAQACDAASDHEGALARCRETYEMLNWLDGYQDLQNYPGILDKAAELYCSYGGIFFQNGDMESGRDCYRKATDTFETLAKAYGNDFWYARSLWVMAHQGLQEFLCAGDASVMLRCERQCEQALKTRFGDARDAAIAQAAMGLILVQKGTAMQQNGDTDGAIEQTVQGIRGCRTALETLEADREGMPAGYRLVIESIVCRLFATYVGAQDTLGVLLYGADRLEEAQEALQAALALLGDQARYGLSEAAATMVRAESLCYLALIAAASGNGDEMAFYADQAVGQTGAILGKFQNPAIARTQSIACSLLAEHYLNIRDKQRAGRYAVLGLESCEELERLEPGAGEALSQLLEKYARRAARRFF